MTSTVLEDTFDCQKALTELYLTESPKFSESLSTIPPACYKKKGVFFNCFWNKVWSPAKYVALLNTVFPTHTVVEVPKSFYDGEEQTKGVELDLNADLNEQWKLNVNAVYQDARDKKNPNTSSFDTRQKGVPYVTASSWLSYDAKWFDLVEPLTISAGVQYVDDRSTNSTSFGIPDGYVPSYTVYDAAIQYQTDDWKLQLNLNNLFNKTYYSKAMFLGGMPGEERNAKLTFSYTL